MALWKIYILTHRPLGDVAAIKYVTFKNILQIKFMSACEIALRWMPQITFVTTTLVQVMAWCCQAPSHHLIQCSLRSMSPCYSVTRPHWVYICIFHASLIWDVFQVFTPGICHIKCPWCSGHWTVASSEINNSNKLSIGSVMSTRTWTRTWLELDMTLVMIYSETCL